MTNQKINLSKLNAHCINNIVHCPLNKQITKISSDKQYVKHESFALHELVHIIVYGINIRDENCRSVLLHKCVSHLARCPWLLEVS